MKKDLRTICANCDHTKGDHVSALDGRPIPCQHPKYFLNGKPKPRNCGCMTFQAAVQKQGASSVINEERAFWKRYEQPFGWRLVGWTYKRHATFTRLADGSTVSVGDVGHVRPEELALALKEKQ